MYECIFRKYESVVSGPGCIHHKTPILHRGSLILRLVIALYSTGFVFVSHGSRYHCSTVTDLT
jgi:hypothetical protein